MTNITAVSRCLSQGKNLSEFHFNGEFRGHMLKGISVSHSSYRKFAKRTDYIMRLQILGYDKGIMNCKLITGQRLGTLKGVKK